MDNPKTGILGDIPEGFADWFCKESGTYWYNNKWNISSENPVIITNLKGQEVKMYKINQFQVKLDRAKKHIIEMANLSREQFARNVGNKEVFELMRNRQTDFVVKGQQGTQDRKVTVLL